MTADQFRSSCRGDLARAHAALLAAAACAAVAAPAHAIEVYVISTGDPSLDASIQATLGAHGHTATIGQKFWKFDGTASLVGMDAVYTSHAFFGDMPPAGQSMLRDWVVRGGGGLVTDAFPLVRASSGGILILQSVFPTEPPMLGYDAQPVTFQRVVEDPVLSAGLPASFTTTPMFGMDCVPRLPPSDAMGFYELATDLFVTYGLVGGSAGAGKVVNIGIAMGHDQISDPNMVGLLSNSLQWVSTGSPPSGADLAILSYLPPCAAQGQPVTFSARIWNYGADASGPVTVTVDLPSAAVAAYASATPAPSMVTPATATFQLPALSGGAAFADVSITLDVVGVGPVAMSATAAAAGDIDPSNNSAPATADVVSPAAQVFVEVNDAPEVSGGAVTGAGPLTAIEGALSIDDADMFRVRVDDWAAFSASHVDEAFALGPCAGPTFHNTALFLFDDAGQGIAFNDNGGVPGAFALLEAGSALYAGRTDGETVWIAIAGYDYDPVSAGGEIWFDDPFETTRPPDGPGSAGVLQGWTGTYGGEGPGTYRITLTGVSAVGECGADLDASGAVDVFDLLAYLDLWFIAAPAADIDGASGVDVFDLLVYLDGWFVGC